VSQNALAAIGPVPDDVALVAAAAPELRVMATLRARYSTSSYSAATWAAYRADLRIFGAWCQDNHVAIFDATRQDIEEWMRDMAAEGRAPSTIRRRLVSVQEFYLEAQEAGYVDRVPTLRLRRPRPSTRQKLGVGREAARLLIEEARARDALTPAARPDDQTGPQHEALLLVQVLNGLRASEAASLRVRSVATQGGIRTIRFVGKGGKDREEALADVTAAALDQLIAFRCGGPDTPLFTTSTGKQMTRHDVRRFTLSLGRAVGIPGFNPHENRHTFVDQMLAAGVPMHRAQDAADHSDPRTTDAYRRARTRLAEHPTHKLARHLLGEDPPA
jgi:integrase/recombinase XerD